MVRRRHIAVLAAVVATSRVVYYALGVRFDAGAIPNAVQLLPPHLLRHDLLRSIWYLHSQPPLFNAFVGLLLHIPAPETWVFGATFVLMGFALAWAMFLMMVELETPVRVALIVTSVFIASPITVLYENWLFYSYPVALLLCVAALCFARFARTHRTRDAAAFGVALALLALSRASFHIVFVVSAAVSLAFVCMKGERRRAVVAALLPLSLVAGLYAKNEIQFGQATSSTWLGMNLAHMVLRHDISDVRADVAARRLSPEALTVPFAPLSEYRDAARSRTGVPALDIVAENGHTNFNNRAYVAISNNYLKDTLRFVRLHPGVYVSRVGQSFRVAGASAADYRAFRDNRAHIAPLVALQNRLLGQERDLVPYAPAARTPGWGPGVVARRAPVHRRHSRGLRARGLRPHAPTADRGSADTGVHRHNGRVRARRRRSLRVRRQQPVPVRDRPARLRRVRRTGRDRDHGAVPARARGADGSRRLSPAGGIAATRHRRDGDVR